jgi:hypothetical protein
MVLAEQNISEKNCQKTPFFATLTESFVPILWWAAYIFPDGFGRTKY